MFAGWLNRGQQASIEYLQEENRVLRELHGARRFRFNDEQRARLARKAKALPHAVLREIGSLVNAGHADALVPPAHCAQV